MKKVWLGSIIAALAVEIIGAAVNLISYAATGYFLLCYEMQGGEWTGESGFGILLNHTYPMTSIDNPASGSNWISFDPVSLILTLAAAFIAFFIIFFIIHKVRKNKAAGKNA